jgi:HSP20 family protein
MLMSSESRPEKRDEVVKREEDKSISRRTPRYHIEDIFDDFRRDIEDFMERSWWPLSSPSFSRFPSLSWRLPAFAESSRIPVCDMIDKGYKYELQVEVPGIEKEKIDVKATRKSIEISGEKSEKTEDRGKNYLYNERSYKSFRRTIAIPEEILPSKIEAKMNNGVLTIDAPKKTPTKVEEEVKKVEVK